MAKEIDFMGRVRKEDGVRLVGVRLDPCETLIRIRYKFVIDVDG
jgi:hypothetical protein